MNTYLAILTNRAMSFCAANRVEAETIAFARYGSDVVSVMLHTPARS